jgi:zinc transporter, ZIP family
MSNVWIALGLTFAAGMATAIGSVIAFAAKRTNYRFLAVATGFSGGAMLYVSFVEIYFKGAESLVGQYGENWGHWVNTASFFGGMLLTGLIDALIPGEANPHEIHSDLEIVPLRKPSTLRLDSVAPTQTRLGSPDVHDHIAHRKLMRTGMFTAFAIGIHNFPEGMATFLAALEDPSLGVPIAIAIALHNIPEGISVSVPIFYATGSRRKAFVYSALSGLAEPVGAIIGYVAIRFFLGGTSGVIPAEVMGMLFAGIAGIMVYISLDELLPTSRAYGKGHDSVCGLVAGMLVMAVSLLLMK